jgi:hypothetical protein
MTEATKRVSVYFWKKISYEVHDLEVPIDADLDEVMELVEADGSYYSSDLFEIRSDPTIVTTSPCIVKRYALIQGDADLRDVQDYLPSNYTATATDDGILISGHDHHGWTLDDYVLPRLGSALIAGKEVFL